MPAWPKPEVSRIFFGGKEYAVDLFHSLAGATRQSSVDLQIHITRIKDATLANEPFQNCRIRSPW